jgi:serine phosphatase RsbU (regulator of sigma subunit)/anti-sigma regulatory factor (Ser/Thr protein kinase)
VRSLDTSAERLDGVLTVLASAGRALTQSVEIKAALSHIAQLVCESLADSCRIEIGGHALGSEQCSVSAHAPRLPYAQAIDIVEQIGDGHELLGTISCRIASAAQDHELVQKAISVLATEIGAVLAGLAVMRREQRVADRLQRALLPEHLPSVSGAEFHAAYRPASNEAEVGGDWYDAFPLPDGRVAVSIGDVAGDGLEAAVIMGEVRQAVRTAAVAATRPSEVLDYVNRIVALRDSVGMVTAVFGIYDPDSSLLTYATAGHPPPLLALANGVVRYLPGGNLPLGCTDTLECRDWTFTLPAGADAIFYADGLIENDRDIFAGERRLVETARELLRERNLPATGVWDPALELQNRIFNGSANRDDTAVLFLSRIAPVPYYVFSALPLTASLARAIVNDEMEPLGIQPEQRFGILVAVGEAIANAIEHAYRDGSPGLIRLELSTEGRQIAFCVEDFGHWRPFVRNQERGRGFELMHAFMDGVQIRSTRDSTRIVLKTSLGSSRDDDALAARSS